MLKFDAEYDVVTAGLGTAGAIAALVAGEAGLSVCGVERLNICGGTATAGGVHSYYYGLDGGRFEEVDRMAREWEKDFTESREFHYDAKGIALEQSLLAAGVEILYESTVVEVHRGGDGKSVRGVTVNTPAGLRRLGCRVLIDATGDGEVCAAAGAAFRLGRPSDGKCQPYSSIRVIRHGDTARCINFDAGYVKCNDAADMTRAIIHSNALHAAEKSDLYFITRLPGLREGRLIDCEECLTAENLLLSGRATPNKILAYGYANFDSHSQDWALTEQVNRDLVVVSSLWGKLFLVPITLEMLLVKGFDNLLVVGRALSVDHMTASLLRMQPCMQKSAEIAARAAIHSLRKGIPLRTVNREKLAAELLESGCLNTILPDCSFAADEAELRAMMGSDKPGEAIFLTGRNLSRYRPFLLELLESGDPCAVPHSALALGLGGDTAGLPVLRQLVRERDSFAPQSSRAQNQRRILGAVDLLGRLGDAQDAELLFEILSAMPPDLQLCSHVVRSLLELGDRLPECREKVRNSIESLLQSDAFDDMLLLKNSSSIPGNVYEPLKPSLRKLADRHFAAWSHHDTGHRTLS